MHRRTNISRRAINHVRGPHEPWRAGEPSQMRKLTNDNRGGLTSFQRWAIAIRLQPPFATIGGFYLGSDLLCNDSRSSRSNSSPPVANQILPIAPRPLAQATHVIRLRLAQALVQILSSLFLGVNGNAAPHAIRGIATGRPRHHSRLCKSPYMAGTSDDQFSAAGQTPGAARLRKLRFNRWIAFDDPVAH